MTVLVSNFGPKIVDMYEYRSRQHSVLRRVQIVIYLETIHQPWNVHYCACVVKGAKIRHCAARAGPGDWNETTLHWLGSCF